MVSLELEKYEELVRKSIKYDLLVEYMEGSKYISRDEVSFIIGNPPKEGVKSEEE